MFYLGLMEKRIIINYGRKRGWYIYDIFIIFELNCLNKLEENNWIKEVMLLFLIIIVNNFNIFSSSEFNNRFRVKRLDYVFL